jgi:hypothetical protein
VTDLEENQAHLLEKPLTSDLDKKTGRPIDNLGKEPLREMAGEPGDSAG